MILVDPRSGADSGKPNSTVDQMVAMIRRIGVPCEKSPLEYADACMEGNGPRGRILIGIERKSLHDMLACIEDSRYAAHQKPGMHNMYAKSFLMVEGMWRPHDPDGYLMEGFQGGASWGQCRFRSKSTLYSKLYRYLLSVSLSGVTVLYSRDLFGTAYNTCEIYNYFQKKWENHTSLITPQSFAIPDFNSKPSLVRRWAFNIEDIGAKFSLEAEKLFKTGLNLANSEEGSWMRIKGVGARTAQNIIKEIRGIK